jgi:hypothetical protein
MERLETNASPRYAGQWAARALDGLRYRISRSVGKLLTRGGGKDTPSRKMRSGLNIPPSPNNGVWYNAAMREAGQRRGF